jgi:phosphonate transport system substrate-binding protein
MALFLALACSDTEPVKDVSLKENTVVPPVEADNEEGVIRIAIGSMITPKEGYAYYRRLLDYIGEQFGADVRLVDREDYAEVNAMLKSGDVDVAFVCSGPYVDGREEFGLELLVQPQAYGRTVYYSYLIVPAESPVDSLERLRGKTFAFTDPKSNTGRLVPTYMLARMGETPESFFREHVFTYAHDSSIKAVANHLVDGAAVDSLVWDYLDKTDPKLTSMTRIIMRSEPYGIPPVAVRPGLDPAVREGIRDILLDMHNRPRGREILGGMMVERFVPAEDGDYDSVRRMKAWLAKGKATERQ